MKEIVEEKTIEQKNNNVTKLELAMICYSLISTLGLEGKKLYTKLVNQLI